MQGRDPYKMATFNDTLMPQLECPLHNLCPCVGAVARAMPLPCGASGTVGKGDHREQRCLAPNLCGLLTVGPGAQAV